MCERFEFRRSAVALLAVFLYGSLAVVAFAAAEDGAADESAPDGARESAPSADNVEQIDFARDVRPILVAHCYKCHGPTKQESNFRLDARKSAMAGGDFGEAAIVPGKSGESPLFRYASRAEEGMEMPPEDANDRLDEREIAVLKKWIDAGAAWPDALAGDADSLKTDHWSFQPLRRPSPPSKAADSWGSGEIDRFILKRLEEANLSPSPEADRVSLIRRLYLTTIGLLPTPEEIERFVADDRPDAYRRLVETVLASPRYGERWARHWLDVVRFGETHGFETNQTRPTAYHYRDYVIASLNDDKPYDQFIVEQLAGDATGEDAATGFLVGGAYDVVKSPDVNLTLMQRQDELADMVNVTGTTFLGLTLGCARCHNHKFDPILQKDYYAVQAVFAGVQHGERALRFGSPMTAPNEVARRLSGQIARLEKELRAPTDGPLPDARSNRDAFPPVEAKFVRFTILATNSAEPCIDELEVYRAGEGEPKNVALASSGARATASSSLPGHAIHKLAHVNDGIAGNPHSWISNEPGKGWVQIELPEPTAVDRVNWGRDRKGRFADRLATEYVIETSLDGSAWQPVASSALRRASSPGTSGVDAVAPEQFAKRAKKFARLTRLRAELANALSVNPPMMAYAGTFKQPKTTHRLYRGDPFSPREEVAPGALSVLDSLDMKLDEPEQQRRLKLAEWVADPKNPLTARVMVNRIWQHHFGTGIVSTPSDFGANGVSPSHPELLDWLASELIDSGWSIKHVQRLILLSSTYRQSDRPREEGIRVDAACRLLWRFPPRRLEAEAIRDCVLEATGSLNLQSGGPGFSLFTVQKETVLHFFPKTEFGPDEWRRMIYMTKIRQEQDSVFGAFDCPDGGQAIANRSRSTTPLQALNLLNSEFMLQQADLFAARLIRDAGDEPPAQVDRAFQLLFGRSPEGVESEASVELLKVHGLPAFCRAMLNANEFLFVP